MKDDFALVREAFADSLIGRTLAHGSSSIAAAWRSSAIGNAIDSRRARLSAMPKAASIATIALVIAIASAMQPLLIALMPRTVAPALPWPAFIVVAVFAAAIALRPAAFVAAWDGSVLGRLTRR